MCAINNYGQIGFFMDEFTSEDLAQITDVLREALGRVSVNLPKNGGDKGLSGASAKLIKDFNVQARNMTSSIGQITTSMKTLGGSAEELSSGIKSILKTGFFGAIGGAVFAELIEAGEGLVKTYRHLSDVGETFGGSMLSMSKAAADANLPLDEFAAMITRNSVAAEQLEQTSKTTGTSFSSLQKGVSQNLKSLGMYGMSLSEISELTGDYSETLRLSNAATYRNKDAMTDQITKFAADISEWSAATGRSRKELEEATNDTLRSISATSLQLDKGQQDALTKANAGLNALDPSKQFANALNDTIAQIQQGGNVANTDFYQKMVKANPAVAAQIGEQFMTMAKKVLGRSVKDSDLDELAKQSQKAFEAQKKNLYFQAYNAKNADSADLYGTLNQIDGYLTPAAKAAREAAGKQGIITNQFLQLESNLTALGTSFKSSILKVLGIFDDSGNQASVDAADKKMTEMFKSLDSIASSVGSIIGSGLKYLLDGSFSKDIEPLKTTLAPYVRSISDSFKDFGHYLDSAQFGKDLAKFKTDFKATVTVLSTIITKVIHGFEAVDHALAWVFGKFDNNGPMSKGLAAVVTTMLGFAAIFKGPKLIASIAKGIFGTLTQRVDIKAPVVNVNGGGGGGGIEDIFGNGKGKGGKAGKIAGAAEEGVADLEKESGVIGRYFPSFEKYFPTFAKYSTKLSAWLPDISGLLANMVPMLGAALTMAAPVLITIGAVIAAAGSLYLAYDRIKNAYEKYKDDKTGAAKYVKDGNMVSPNQKQIDRIKNDPDFALKVSKTAHGKELLKEAGVTVSGAIMQRERAKLASKLAGKTAVPKDPNATPTAVPKDPNATAVLQQKYNKEANAAELLQKSTELNEWKTAQNGGQATPAMQQMQIDLNKQILEELKKLNAISAQASKANVDIQKKGISIAGRQV
jgi:hypothetical protein